MAPENPFLTAEDPIILTHLTDGEALYRYYKEHRGFDPAIKGGWQETYAAMIDAVFRLHGRRVLDLGAAMGALTWAMQERGADVWGIEINKYFVEHSPFEAIRGRLILGDAVEMLALFRHGTFDLIHASQVLEHITLDRQAALFAELARVLSVGGFLFASLPMGVGPDHGITDGDDATHVCLRPREWWDSFRNMGFREASPDYEQRLVIQPLYQAFRWDHFIWERI